MQVPSSAASGGAIRILPATPRDLPVILALIRALADYERLGHAVVATTDALRDTLFGASPRAEVAIAWSGDTAAGFAVWFHNYSTFLGRAGVYLEDLFVLPEYRGRGIGRRLIAHVAGVAVDRHSGRREWAVLEWNSPAIGFYRSLGAEPLDDWRLFRLTGDALKRVAASRG